MGRRTLLLIAAFLLAAIGTGALFVYVRSAERNAREGGSTVQVLVPKERILSGTRISKTGGEFGRIPVSGEDVKRYGMVTAPSAVADKIVSQELPAGLPVTPAQFGTSVKDAAKLPIDEGKMALTIELDDFARVAEFLAAGSRVAVFVTDPEVTRTAAAAPTPRHESRLLLPDVLVLTVGVQSTIRTSSTAATGSAQGGQGVKSLVTLQVDQTQAGQILVAQEAGDLYLTLLGPTTTPTPRIYDDRNLDVR
jgi:pilus assembly protein CpaB